MQQKHAIQLCNTEAVRGSDATVDGLPPAVTRPDDETRHNTRQDKTKQDTAKYRTRQNKTREVKPRRDMIN